jgi:hypothetical protein
MAFPSFEASRFAPERSCECHAGQPSEPASRLQSPSPERRRAEDHASLTELKSDIPLSIAPIRAVDPAESPPTAPLYIRTSRLLI